MLTLLLIGFVMHIIDGHPVAECQYRAGTEIISVWRPNPTYCPQRITLNK